MSAKRQTFCVEKTEGGWVVKTDAHEEHLGPYSEWARAMTMALIFARCNQPSQVKVKADAEYWRGEYNFYVRGHGGPLRPPRACRAREVAPRKEVGCDLG